MTTVHFVGGSTLELNEDSDAVAQLLRGAVSTAHAERLDPRFNPNGQLLSFVGRTVDGDEVTINGAAIAYVVRGAAA